LDDGTIETDAGHELLTDAFSSALNSISGITSDFGNIDMDATVFGLKGDINNVGADANLINNATDLVNKGKSLFKFAFKKEVAKAANVNIYSPSVFSTQLTFTKDIEDVSLSPDPQIVNDDILSVTINQATEESKATVVLNNRQDCGSTDKIGKYTFVPGKNNFCGIKPIKIGMGYKGENSENNLPTVFTGFVTKRRYERPSPTQSICILECEDMSKRARDTFAVNLPFFDGWCHLAVIYYLAKQAGYSDDEILIFQDPDFGSSKVKIRELLTGNPDTLSGGCFDGHSFDTPKGSGGFSSTYLHQTLPLAVIGAGEGANYAFDAGTSLWTCMQKVREFSRWYLFANNFGNIIYGPPSAVTFSSNKKFKEVDNVGNFDEIQGRLSVSYDTNETRNGVWIQGLQWVPNRNDQDKQVVGCWEPIVRFARVKDFPKNIGDHSFAPYERYVFFRNPKFESEGLIQAGVAEYLRRFGRTRGIADFSAWGNPAIFPYMTVELDESVLNETGLDKQELIVAAHTLSLSSDNYKMNSSFSLETFDPEANNYDPNLINLRE
jgi:hypothetical protein